MKGMSRALRFGKSVADNGWRIFTTFLAYKLQEQGKQLVKIDKWFPSTKMCSNCGNKKKCHYVNARMLVCVDSQLAVTITQRSISKRSHPIISVDINSNKITFGTRELARLS